MPAELIHPERVLLIAGGKSGPGEIQVRHLSPGERLASTLVTLGLMLFLTSAAIFIPVLHFILVPLGLVLTIILVSARFARKAVIETGSGVCPACGATVRIFPQRYRLPLRDVCEGCRRAVDIQQVRTRS